jgi:CDP-diacylglycerol--glycerol-3-phosphate 3-phosphatidyltransferase
VTLYALKPRFQALLRPLVGRLAASGVTANQVTVAAAAGSIALGAVLTWTDDVRLFVLLPLWLFLRMALNAVDGMLAREHAQQSRLGFFLNEIGDVLSDAALIAPFATVHPFSAAWVLVVVVLAGVTELAGVLAAAAGGARRYDGPMGKSDRAVVFGALGLWVGIGPVPAWLAWLLPALAALLALTVVHRVRGGLVHTPAA